MRSTQCYQAFRTTALAALRLLAVLIVLSASARLASAVVRNSYGTRAVKFDFDLIIAGAGPVGLSVARLLSQRGHFGRMLIDCRAHDLPALGYAVPYGALMRALTGNIGTIGSVRHLKR